MYSHVFSCSRAMVLGLLLVLSCTSGWATVQETDAEPAFVDVAGRVVGPGDIPVVGATVSLLDRTARTDGSGEFSFEHVPATRQAVVNLRVVNKWDDPVGCTTLSFRAAFYPVAAVSGTQAAVVIFSTESPDKLELLLEPVEGLEVEAFCGRCHKPNPCLQTLAYGEGGEQPKRLGGIAVREDEIPAIREQLLSQGMGRAAYTQFRYQDAHPQQIDLDAILNGEHEAQERFQEPANLTLHENSRITCDTCHTRHMPSAQSPYMVMEYSTQNTLCLECHL